ncbi:MAG TPA: replicative DNA helicase [Micropepsaceae bacterium]|nr:replicative DNA helicase [Micropepsaceae bacterium]
MELEVHRQLPYDVDVEQALLGAVLVDNYSLDLATRVLTPEQFYDPLHQRLFTAMERMWGAGQIVTPLTLKVAMEKDAGLAEVGGQTYLVNLARAAPVIPNVKEYARILADFAIRRSLIHIGENIVNTAYEAPREIGPSKQIEDAEKSLYQIAEQSRFGEATQSFQEAMARAIQATETAMRKGAISGVASGFTELDSVLGGLHSSDLIIIAGRPGMGKTSLATNIAFHAANVWMKDKADGADPARGAPVLMFSLEMSADQLAARILSEQTEIEMRKIRSGRAMTDSEFVRLTQKAQNLSTLPLYIDDTGGISIAQIAARARRYKREKKIGMIVIDYLQLVEPATRRSDNRVQEVSEVTKGMKALAKELSVPVIALSQLSRSVDSRDDKRPVLSDLRESGSIEQDADVVMFVYREEYYLVTHEPDIGTPEYEAWMKKMERALGKADIIVEKHRHGATKAIQLNFDSRFTRFSNSADEHAGLAR